MGTLRFRLRYHFPVRIRPANPAAIIQLLFRLDPPRCFDVPRAETYTSAHFCMISSALCCKHPFRVLSCRYLTVLSSLNEHVHVLFQSRCRYLDPGLEDPHRITSCRFLKLQRVPSTEFAVLRRYAIISETELLPGRMQLRSRCSSHPAGAFNIILAERKTPE